MNQAKAYPLCWVAGIPRTPAPKRKDSPFRVNNECVSSLFEHLRLLGARNVVVSSNQPLKANNLPYAELSKEAKTDPGVAIFGEYKGKSFSFACDNFNNVFANFRALALSVEGYRRNERYGITNVAGQMYNVFDSLPAPVQKSEWQTLLGVPAGAPMDEIEAAFRNWVKTHRPDLVDRACACQIQLRRH